MKYLNGCGGTKLTGNLLGGGVTGEAYHAHGRGKSVVVSQAMMTT